MCTVQVSRISVQPKRVLIEPEEAEAVNAHLEECKNPPKVPKTKQVKKTTVKKLSKATPKKTKGTPKKAAKASPQLGKRKATSKLQSTAKKTKVSPYAHVKLYNSDPLLQNGFVIDPVAPSVNCNIFTQAVYLNKTAEVSQLAKDLDLVAGFHCSYGQRSFANPLVRKSAWHHAIERQNKPMIKLLYTLVDEDKALIKNKRVRTSVTSSQLHVSQVLCNFLVLFSYMI